MAQEIFKRIEKKYLLSKQQYEAVKAGIAAHMQADRFSNYSISNIYFDTEDYRMISESLEQPAYKEKIRLRSYGTAKEDQQVFLELKKKYDGVVYKRRILLPLKEARAYLLHGVHPGTDSQIFREIDYAMRFYKPAPAVHLSYDREAFAGIEDPELRLTFDSNIRGRQYLMDLKYLGFGDPVLPDGKILMEVKIPGVMPLWMSRLFSENRVYPESFSKYGKYYQEYILGSANKGGSKIA